MTLLNLYIFQIILKDILQDKQGCTHNSLEFLIKIGSLFQSQFIIRMRKYLKEGQYSYTQDELLGKGSFGKVFRGYDHINSRWVAIKAIHLQVIYFHGPQMKSIVCNEISVMRKFTTKMKQKPCSYLVQHYDCFRTDTFVYIVMEICQEGTLQNYIQKGALTEEQTKNIVKQILQGLAYLEQMSVCHRDLKPDNIFISSQFDNGVNQVVYKIGDFGFAAQKASFNQTLGTYPFMAPEIFNKEQYTTKVDVWSLGIITYQLLFQEMYFMGKNKWQIEQKVKNSTFTLASQKKDKVSNQMQQFLNMCLTKDKEKRPKASQLLKCQLFQVKQENSNVIFEAIQNELLFCELLRSMAEQICGFGIANNRNTEFIQIYFLKKSFAAINLISYSLVNRQNYLNIPNQIFNSIAKEENQSQLNEILDKVEKQNILMNTVFRDKYKQFSQYIKKYSESEISAIENIIRVEQIYSDINKNVFQQQLQKWIQALESQAGYQSLKLKCQKLYQVS